MAETGEVKFLSQADFARRRGVSRKSVTKWKEKGLLVLTEDGRVNVEETEWKLDDRPAKYRGGVTHRPVRDDPGNRPAGNTAPKAERPAKGNSPAPRPSAREPDDAEPADFDPDDPNLPTSEALRRKENFLGLLRKRELEVSNGEWVRVEEVGAQVEREYATVRERLLTIPGKLAALLVGADRATIEAALRREVTEALHELHDPAGVAGRGAAGGPSPPSQEGA